MLLPTISRSRSPRRASLAVAAVLAAATVVPAAAVAEASGHSPVRTSAAPAGAPASAATRTPLMPGSFPRQVVTTIDLCATTGTTQLPRSSGTTPDTVTVWGYVAGDCAGAAGTATLGGAPVISAVAGETVTVVLHNDLPQTTSLSFQGQTMPTDRVGAAPGGTRTYTVHLDHPGTFLYEAGFAGDTAVQVAMGLHGVITVMPATPGQAYDMAGSAFDQSAIVLISEIDPALHANPNGFDMRKFAPKWTALNGTVFSSTAPLATVAPGDALLLRYVNAGANYHSMSVLGGNQRVIADDGNPKPNAHSVVAQTVGPGQTTDVIIDVSANAADGTSLTVFDGSLQVRNRNRRPTAAGTFRTYGGALAFVAVSGTTSGTDTLGPVTSGASVDPDTGAVAATVSDASNGASDVAGAEYSLDALAPAGTGTPMVATDGAFDSPTEAVTAAIPLATLQSLASGTHTVYVRGRDAAGNWGAATARSFAVDRAGPATTGVAFTPTPPMGPGAVALHATGSDAATGGATVVAAEYFIDGPVVDGAGTPMAINNPLATVSLDATIAAATVGGLSTGAHTISVHARDALGNWGPVATATLTIDRTGPTVTGGAVAPNPTNGVIGVNTSVAALRVTATASDSSASIARAEGFIDTVGAPGTGFPMVPADGSWSSATELISVDIPNATIRTLSDGTHTVHVRARDLPGNWGATIAVPFVVDTTAPTVSGVSITPSANAATVTATASDALTGVAAVEMFVDTDPGRGAATPMPLVSGSTYVTSLSTLLLTEGTHTVVVRSRDAAGNWSTNSSTTLNVVRTVHFSTRGNTNPPGVGGTADNADIYRYAGSFARAVDMTAAPRSVPTGANVDGLVRISDTDFYVSFAADVSLPGLGTVQDEDIVHFAGGTWSVFFDGTAAGLTAAGQDIDAFDIVGSTIWFSTVGNTNPPGVTGAADDADLYTWDGTSFARAVDASTIGVPGSANVDGLAFIGTQFLLSFAADVTLPGVGTVQDEDIALRNGAVWSVWMDGTAKGLTNNNHDLDAIDV